MSYSPELMRWSTAEPSGAVPYVDGLNLYEAFGNNPVNRTDPNGTIQVHTLNSYRSTAGSFKVTADLFLDKPSPKGGGYIVQQITRVQVINGQSQWLRYWEAWFVREGKRDPDINPVREYTDIWADDPKPGTSGYTIVGAEIKFFAALKCGKLGNPYSNPPLASDPMTHFKPYGSGHSGDVPSSPLMKPGDFSVVPSWWNDMSDNGEEGATRSLEIHWNDKRPGIANSPIFSGVDKNGQRVAHGYPSVFPVGAVEI